MGAVRSPCCRKVCLHHGQQHFVVLPDGSRITLDKESRLEYDGDFGRDERNVRLVGKGFFEVEKMPDKRFVVEMGDVQVSVLGTTFDASNRMDS